MINERTRYIPGRMPDVRTFLTDTSWSEKAAVLCFLLSFLFYMPFGLRRQASFDPVAAGGMTTFENDRTPDYLRNSIYRDDYIPDVLTTYTIHFENTGRGEGYLRPLLSYIVVTTSFFNRKNTCT